MYVHRPWCSVAECRDKATGMMIPVSERLLLRRMTRERPSHYFSNKDKSDSALKRRQPRQDVDLASKSGQTFSTMVFSKTAKRRQMGDVGQKASQCERTASKLSRVRNQFLHGAFGGTRSLALSRMLVLALALAALTGCTIPDGVKPSLSTTAPLSHGFHGSSGTQQRNRSTLMPSVRRRRRVLFVCDLRACRLRRW